MLRSGLCEGCCCELGGFFGAVGQGGRTYLGGRAMMLRGLRRRRRGHVGRMMIA